MPKPNALAKPKVGDKPRGTDEGWVEQPTGRKAQRKAKREAAQALEAAVSAVAVKDGQAAVIAVDEDMPEPLEPSVLQQLETAKQRVHELDAIGDAARAAIPGFSVMLEAAKAHRDGLQKERKAARPARWRLVQGCASANADAATKNIVISIVVWQFRVLDAACAKYYGATFCLPGQRTASSM